MNAARLAAARTLLSLDRGRTTLAAEVERERGDLPDVRDRGLFMEVVTGTVRWRAELDACIVTHSRRSLDELMPEVRAVMRTGAYQLLHLDRVPSHAVVSEAVDIVRALGQPRAAGLVNAVLRKLAGKDARKSLPTRQDDLLRYLSISLSHPDWLVKRWLDRLGLEAAERWCQFNNTSPTVTVRPIPGMTMQDVSGELRAAGVEGTPARFATDTIQLAAGTLGRLSPALRESLVVQDEGSVLVAIAAGVQPGERVLDVCAAPGGKTLVFAQAAGPDGLVVASDVRPARVELLRSVVDRGGITVPVLAVDAAVALPFGPVFDRVVLDAPCSGLGTLRRDPDIKWSRQESDLARMAEAQARMLDQAALTVRPGGRLIYATCSSEPEENELVVDAFLARSPEFSIEPVTEGISPSLVNARGFLETLPPRDDLDAFFTAKLVRSGTA